MTSQTVFSPSVWQIRKEKQRKAAQSLNDHLGDIDIALNRLSSTLENFLVRSVSMFEKLNSLQAPAVCEEDVSPSVVSDILTRMQSLEVLLLCSPTSPLAPSADTIIKDLLKQNSGGSRSPPIGPQQFNIADYIGFAEACAQTNPDKVVQCADPLVSSDPWQKVHSETAPEPMGVP